METKELKIEIPLGYEIDKEKTTFEKIVFKKKDSKPRSWEEYCKKFKGRYYYIQDEIRNINVSFTPTGLCPEYKNILPSKELAEAFIAMMQLMSLRQAWIGDWKPNWNWNNLMGYYCINVRSEKIRTDLRMQIQDPLSFPTQEMAEDFMNCFKDLLEIAKPLI